MKQIPTPQLIRIFDPTLVPSATTFDASEAIDTPDQSRETIWEEFLRLQQKPRTRQEYSKSINYFCKSMAPGKSPTTFLPEFLVLPKNAAIHLVLEWRQHQISEGKASYQEDSW